MTIDVRSVIRNTNVYRGWRCVDWPNFVWTVDSGEVQACCACV